MGSPLLHVGAVAMCPHGGSVQIVPGQARVTVGNMPVATLSDTAVVAGCGMQPVPCVKAQYVMGATRVTVGGVPALLTSSTALTIGAGPQGSVSVVQSQTRVTGA